VTTTALLAAEGGGRPIPVLFTLRVGVVLAMRDTAVVFVAPGPIVTGALFLWRGSAMLRRTTSRKTTLLLLKPELVALAFGLTATAGSATRGMFMSLLAAEGGGGPIPVLVAIRVVGKMLLVRNAAAVFFAPRPIVGRALSTVRRIVMMMRTAPRKTATLLLEPEFIFLTLGWAMLAVAGLGRDKWECRSDQKECSHHTSNDSHMD
jgi:hypothetical protein